MAEEDGEGLRDSSNAFCLGKGCCLEISFFVVFLFHGPFTSLGGICFL